MARQSTDAKLLELIGEVQGLLELAELREGLLVALDRVVPSDWISINEIGPDPEHIYTVVRPPLSDLQVATFARFAHQNPLIERFERTRDTRPYRFSDVITPAGLHALDLYREFYAELGIEHQIAFIVRMTPESYIGIALARRTHDFTEAERTLLDRARPHLIQIYRNALAYAARGGHEDAGALERALIARGLTARAAQVLSRVAHGESNADVGEALGISERTVAKHLERTYRTLGVTTRSQAAAAAWQAVLSVSTRGDS